MMDLVILLLFIALIVHNVLQHNRVAALERRLDALENSLPRH